MKLIRTEKCTCNGNDILDKSSKIQLQDGGITNLISTNSDNLW